MRVIRLKQAGSMFYFTGSILDFADPTRPTGDLQSQQTPLYITSWVKRNRRRKYPELEFANSVIPVPSVSGRTLYALPKNPSLKGQLVHGTQLPPPPECHLCAVADHVYGPWPFLRLCLQTHEVIQAVSSNHEADFRRLPVQFLSLEMANVMGALRR